MASGGYTLQLPAGTYDVKGTGGTLGGTVDYPSVTIGFQNVEEDFTPAQAVVTPPSATEGINTGVVTAQRRAAD